jgi:predicted kinase
MKINEIYKNIHRPEIIIMVGLPGAGKSTLISNKYPNHVIVSSDDIIEKLATGEDKTYDEVFKQFIGKATFEMKEIFKNAIENNKNIVWDQTNLTKKKRRNILNQVPSHYKKIAIVLNIPDKLRYERTAGRKGKSIPSHIMQSMEQSYQSPTKDEGFDEIIEIME